MLSINEEKKTRKKEIITRNQTSRINFAAVYMSPHDFSSFVSYA